ncbi:MAG: LytTR family DNA-binding domain-containing protein [Myxococcales bacterium]|nr:LytTR family DNA-binding domain-containing protein [Myxococcales bacterium]
MTARLGPVLVADDERYARLAVRHALSAVAQLPPIEECSSGEEVVRAIRTLRPSVVFLDISMPDLDGFGVLNRTLQHPVAVVMVTASTNDAVRAYDVDVVDYVVKPFSDARLVAAAHRALRAAALAQLQPLADQAVAEGRHVSLHGTSEQAGWLAVTGHRRTRFVPVPSVSHIRAEGNYAVVVAEGSEHLVRRSLTELQTALAPRFCRIHRSTLVACDWVAHVRRLPSGDGVVVLRNGGELRMSRRYRDALSQLRGV